MTLKEIKAMVASFGLPYAYDHFLDATGLVPPFVVYYYEYSPFFADSSNYSDIRTLVIELATANKDFGAEKAIEAVLSSRGLAWEKEESYIDTEQLYEIIYKADVVIREEVE